ncbi:hypothetical protein Tco_1013106 [Tanacetum coccineum]
MLVNSKVLKTLTVTFHTDLPLNDVGALSQVISRLPRASEDCEIHFETTPWSIRGIPRMGYGISSSAEYTAYPISGIRRIQVLCAYRVLQFRSGFVSGQKLPPLVLEKVGEVAYKHKLLEELSRVHNTFHVSNLKKCYADEPLAVPLDGLHFDDKLQFVEEPVEIMDREVKRLKRSHIPLVKV